MHKFNDNKIINKNYETLYHLVLDIESYPSFLPWCAGAKIISKEDDYLIADLIISFKAFTEKYRSKVTYSIDNHSKEAYINVNMIEGPFNHLNNSWHLKDIDGKSAIVNFAISFEFKSFLLDKLIGGIFDKAQQKLIEAFEKKAYEI